MKISFINNNKKWVMFALVKLLDRHLIQAHAQPASAFHCELCNRAYSSRALLLRHRALTHTDIRKYPCENCPKIRRYILGCLKIEP
ncbi:unnamed protein product [Euphydryas editha]|uniref:C2H2-type domain-containing protein n=1 Tax=Euphydryas editha TaxID=104508 RepID=A0AAU9TZK4_EUPED|nr:unnamed protein product [Euphydryas editha]